MATKTTRKRRPSSSVKELPIVVARRRDIHGREYFQTAAPDGSYQHRFATLAAAVKKARGFARYQRKHAGRHSSVYVSEGPPTFRTRRITNPRRRRNASSSTAAIQKRQQRLWEAIYRRHRAKVGSPAKLGALHGAHNRAGAVLRGRYAAEDRAPGSRLRSMQREAALSRALARARRRGGPRVARLQVAHRRAAARLRSQGWPTMAELERQDQARRKRRRRNPMAKRKRTPAQRAAFRRMIAGLKRHKAQKRRAKARRANPSKPHRRRRRKNSNRGGSIMAKHRRRRSRTNPGRRHHRRRRRNPHHRRHHRRRNPAMGGIVKSTIAAAVPSMAAGAVVALADSKFFADKSMGVQVIGKLIMAGGAGFALRNRPRAAALVMGSIFGTLAYQLVAKSQGGIVSPDKQDTTKKMAALVYSDRRMAALVERSGALRSQPTLGGMGQGMGDGGTALPTMPIYDPVNLG